MTQFPEDGYIKQFESEGEDEVRAGLINNRYGERGTRIWSCASEWLRSKESVRQEGFAKEANLTAKSALVTAAEALEIARQQKTMAAVALTVAIIAAIVAIIGTLIGIAALFR